MELFCWTLYIREFQWMYCVMCIVVAIFCASQIYDLHFQFSFISKFMHFRIYESIFMHLVNNESLKTNHKLFVTCLAGF